jgi:hypothetical protein
MTEIVYVVLIIFLVIVAHGPAARYQGIHGPGILSISCFLFVSDSRSMPGSLETGTSWVVMPALLKESKHAFRIA